MMPANSNKPVAPQAPKVWHLKDPDLPANAVRIDRTTKWGNPYHIGTAHPLLPNRIMDRTDVIALYEQSHMTPEWVHAIVSELQGKDLACWCAPLACHGDFLLEVANRAPGILFAYGAPPSTNDEEPKP